MFRRDFIRRALGLAAAAPVAAAVASEAEPASGIVDEFSRAYALPAPVWSYVPSDRWVVESRVLPLHQKIKITNCLIVTYNSDGTVVRTFNA